MPLEKSAEILFDQIRSLEMIMKRCYGRSCDRGKIDHDEKGGMFA
jgi:hypothetical protein